MHIILLCQSLKTQIAPQSMQIHNTVTKCQQAQQTVLEFTFQTLLNDSHPVQPDPAHALMTCVDTFKKQNKDDTSKLSIAYHNIFLRIADMVLFLYNGKQNLPTNRKLPYTTTSALGTFLLAGRPGRINDNLLTPWCSSEAHSKAILASCARSALARSRVPSVAFVQHNLNARPLLASNSALK